MDTRLTHTVAEAIAAAPCSVRALARSARVSHTMLVLICNGQREATPEVATAVAWALELWAQGCNDSAQRIRRLLKHDRGQT